MPDSTYGLLERTELPNGTELFYRDKDHSYWRAAKLDPKKGWCGSGRLTGVSTVVSPYDWRPDNLMRWAAWQNGEGVAMLASEGLSLDDPDDMRSALSWLQSGSGIWQALADGRLLYSDRSDDAAQRGTNVHEHALHALARGESMPALDQLTPEERGYAQGVVKFWLDHDPEPLQTEQVVFAPDQGVAGRFDLRARLHGSYHGERLGGAICMIDAKTSRSGFIPTTHHVQVAGYDYAAIASGFGASERYFLLKVDAFGDYELVEAQATHDDFLAAVQVYRSAARIGRDCNAARKKTAQASAEVPA